LPAVVVVQTYGLNDAYASHTSHKGLNPRLSALNTGSQEQPDYNENKSSPDCLYKSFGTSKVTVSLLKSSAPIVIEN
jgi:hypothetical protein